MTERAQKRMSRHFTVVVRREFPWTVQSVFSAWTDVGIRRAVLERRAYKNDIKEVSVTEGGIECYEDRWKRRLYSTTVRRYLVIRPHKLIISQADCKLTKGFIDQHFAWQETLLFKPKEEERCELVMSNQCVSIEPSLVHAAEDAIHRMFDDFRELFEKTQV